MSGDKDLIICQICVGEPYLNNLIEKEGVVDKCSYCHEDDEACVKLEELANYIEGAFERHYCRTSDQPDMYESMLLGDRELSYEWYRHGEPVLDAISEATKISEDVAQDVLDVLENRYADFESAQMGEECEFDSESYYEPKDSEDDEFAFEWRAIEHSLKSKVRFFNKSAEAFLERLFKNIEGRVTDDGHPVVVSAGPEATLQSFFRGRVFHKSNEVDDAMIRPDLHVGPPPEKLARAGRMNANGISMFYGASDEKVALAEVRPPVGSRALVAEFKLTRSIKLLDVASLQSVYVEGSIFDPDYLEQMSLAKFLGRLSDRITMPVMPDDEPTEYLITQMIADYLALQTVPGLDGILFPSVQCPGDHRNVVLFNHASRVGELEFPEGTELSARQFRFTEDGAEPDYWVSEQVPAGPEEEDETPEDIFDVFGWRGELGAESDEDSREVTLRVVTESVTAYHVNGVAFTTDDFEVQRHRFEKPVRMSTRSANEDISDTDF